MCVGICERGNDRERESKDMCGYKDIIMFHRIHMVKKRKTSKQGIYLNFIFYFL